MDTVDTLILGSVFLMFLSIGLAVYYLFFYAQEGENCEIDKDADEYDAFGNFKYDRNKKCVLDSCKTGYKKVVNGCVKQVDTPASIYTTPAAPSDVGLYCKETVQCLTGGSGRCGGVDIGRGQKCTTYNTVKLDDGYTLCTDEQSALVPSGTSVGEYVTNCDVDCKWVKKNNETLKWNCEKKYTPVCIPLGDSGSLDTTDSHTYFEGIEGGNKVCPHPPLVSCRDHGLTSCPPPPPAPAPAPAPTGCGANTAWSLFPKLDGTPPTHSDYIGATNEYCKTGDPYLIGGIRYGTLLSPVLTVPITRCHNNVQEIKNVKGRGFFSDLFAAKKGYHKACWDTGNNYLNCGNYKSCINTPEVAYQTCNFLDPSKCRYRFLYDGGISFDDFLKGI